MQHPTLQNVRIRSTRDALQVFHGVATHRLPLITRRLDAEERRNIVPGNVYVWEERGANTEPTGLGMERWTDGMGWGPSRVRDEFLFYHQKDSDVTDDLVNPVTPWAQMMRRPSGRPNGRPFSVEVRALPETERLIKQTYSVHVSLPADRSRGILRKWHLTAYFSPQKLDELHTIDGLRGVGDAVVPEGWFRSARIGRNRRDSRNQGSHTQTSEGSSPPSISTTLNSHQSSNPYHRHPSLSYTHSGGSGGSSSSSTQNNGDTSPRSVSQLVPLEVLVRTAGPRRDPADEQLLRRFVS